MTNTVTPTGCATFVQVGGMHVVCHCTHVFHYSHPQGDAGATGHQLPWQPLAPAPGPGSPGGPHLAWESDFLVLWLALVVMVRGVHCCFCYCMCLPGNGAVYCLLGHAAVNCYLMLSSVVPRIIRNFCGCCCVVDCNDSHLLCFAFCW